MRAVAIMTHGERTGCSLPKVALPLSAVAFSSCIAAYHTKYHEVPASKDWALTASSVVSADTGQAILAHVPIEPARYQLVFLGPPVRWSGYVGAESIEGEISVSTIFTAGPDDSIRLESEASVVSPSVLLKKMVGERILLKNRGAIDVSVRWLEGGYRVRATRQNKAEVYDVTQQMVQTPIKFVSTNTSSGVAYSRGDMVMAQCIWYVIFPPFILADIFLPSKGLASNFRVTEYVELEKKTLEIPAGELRWTSPVASREFDWRLELSAQKKVIRGAIQTDASGSCVIPIAAYKADLLRDIDLGRSARLVVKDVVSGFEHELSVDLIELLQGMTTAKDEESRSDKS